MSLPIEGRVSADGVLFHLTPRSSAFLNSSELNSISAPAARPLLPVEPRVPAVELRLTEIVAPGQVFMPFHFVETNVNRGTQSPDCPVSRELNYKQCAVRMEKTTASRGGS